MKRLSSILVFGVLGGVLLLVPSTVAPHAFDGVQAQSTPEPPLALVAKLAGPTSAQAGMPILLNPSGSIADKLEFGCARGPEKPGVMKLVSEDGATTFGLTTASKTGTYLFYVIAWSKDKARHEFAFVEIVIGEGPAPTPKPPEPKPNPPKPDPKPIPAKDFRVLFLFESSGGKMKLTQEQSNIVNSPKVREYLNRKTPLGGADGRTRDYRFWDQDIVRNIAQQKDSDVWNGIGQTATAWLDQLPAVIVFNGTAGTHYPFPATETQLLELLKKHGGE